MHSIKLVSEELTPSKVVCVGRNYTAHIAELNNETPDQMVLFNKRTAQSKLKNKGLPWERAKAFDGSVILTDFVALTDAMKHFTFELKINNEVIQRGDTHFMLHNPDSILQEISEFMSLEDGDVIMTGTPSGVGEVTAKSIFAVALYANDQCLLEHQWQVSKN